MLGLCGWRSSTQRVEVVRGMRDQRLVNLALLDKWCGRIVYRGSGLWRDILNAWYENHMFVCVCGGGGSGQFLLGGNGSCCFGFVQILLVVGSQREWLGWYVMGFLYSFRVFRGWVRFPWESVFRTLFQFFG